MSLEPVILLTLWFDCFAVAAQITRPFCVRHVEYAQLVMAVEGGQPPTAGKALVAHYSPDSRTGALMFREDPQTRNIVTVDGGLCVTDVNGI